MGKKVIFAENKKIRENIARGNSVIEFKLNSGKKTGTTEILTYPLHANKKFTGGMLDDDDQMVEDFNVSDWKSFFLEDVEKATQIVYTKKENGNASHMAVFKLGGTYYIVAGSKNVHLVCRNREDMSLYGKQERYEVAMITMKAVFDFLEELPTEKRENLLKFLSETHQTAVFELLDPQDQHIELLKNKKPILKFITFTKAEQVKNEEEKSKGKTLCENPAKSLPMAAELGFDVVEHRVYEASKLEEISNDVRNTFYIEGSVLYFLNKEENVIGVLKKKSIWYILVRATREKMKNYAKEANRGSITIVCNSVHEKMRSKLKKRFQEIKKWLNLTDDFVEKWISLAHAMSAWLKANLINGSVNVKDIQRKFPILWNRFLEQTNKTDNITPTFKC